MNRQSILLSACIMILAAGSTRAAQQSERRTGSPPALEGKYHVKIETNHGDIVVEVDADAAPITVRNFLRYVRSGFYDGLIFQRVITDVFVQGGQYDENLNERKRGLRPPIENEWPTGLPNARGTIAMSRQVGKPGTIQSQFFFNLADHFSLDEAQSDGFGFPVFGKVVEGMDVLVEIGGVTTTTSPKYPQGQVVPVEPVVMEKVTWLDPPEHLSRRDDAQRRGDPRRQRDRGEQPESEAEVSQPTDKAQAGARTSDAPRIRLRTSMGDIVLELNAAKAPITVANFVRYVKDDFYAGTTIHRVASGFVLQGGGYDQNMELKRKGLRDGIKNEWKNGLKNEKGTVSMARTTDPDSATSQFFINLADNNRLDEPISGGAGYAVFGKVVEGWKTIEKISKVEVTEHENLTNLGKAVPVTPIVIEKAEIIEPGRED